MIRAFGMNGCGQAAVKLLEEVCSSGVSPNSLTFSSVLPACSHSGLVNDGLKIFDRMCTDFGFKPQTGHFTCLVDLLARTGQLDDAVDFIRKMPHGPDKHSWGSILAAFLEQQSIRIGVLASEHLVNLEPENAGHYVTLSNLYAKAGRPDDAVRVRRLMESRGLVKQFGYSSVSLVASFNSQRALKEWAIAYEAFKNIPSHFQTFQAQCSQGLEVSQRTRMNITITRLRFL
ncbi:pentatricopeptide repeat-containing protein At5g39350-like [Coffea arabica]|uniref:Pentatricopeptide repeat-containing protein At5g39350-like n=1 Tax=Coffea arabica TaxID=13443 RepID=A0ABM4UES4_COFAR